MFNNRLMTCTSKTWGIYPGNELPFFPAIHANTQTRESDWTKILPIYILLYIYLKHQWEHCCFLSYNWSLFLNIDPWSGQFNLYILLTQCTMKTASRLRDVSHFLQRLSEAIANKCYHWSRSINSCYCKLNWKVKYIPSLNNQ